MRNLPPQPKQPRRVAEPPKQAVAGTQAPPAPGIPEAGANRFARPSILIALAAATFGAFAGALRNGWVLLDDPDYVLTNPHINRGLTLDGVRWILRSPHAGNWHPLTSIVHMLDVQVFGMRPAGHHAVSLVLHVLNAVMLALVLNRLTRAWWKSVLVAALFALHPLRVESVAWASELKDVLSGAFFMFVLWAYARWAERPGAARYSLVVGFLALGLLAKPMLVTVPFVLVLLDIWPLGRLHGLPPPTGTAGGKWRAPRKGLAGLVLEKWPMLALVAAFSVITVLVQGASGAVASANSLSLATRVLNASLSYWRYLALTLWPHSMMPFYRLVRGGDVARGAIAALALVGATALALGQARRRPHVLAGWLWYVGTLLPVIGLVQVGQQAYADRYTYLPIIGILVAVIWTADEFWPRGRAARVVAAGLAVAVLAVLGFGTARQVARWKDNRTLFTYSVRVDSLNTVAHECLGSELLKAGRVPESILHFEAALRANSDQVDSRINLGVALGSLGQYEQAADQFRRVLRLRDNASVHHNLGLTLMKLDRTDEAIAEYQAALRLEPGSYSSLVELGAALGARGRFAEADEMLHQALAMQPADATIRRMLAVALTREDSVEAAISNYRVLAARDPADLDALNNIAWIRATHADPRHRDGAEAVKFAELAVHGSREPVAVLYSTLAAAYAEAGRMHDAVQAGGRAVELARAEHDPASADRFAQQLACYRAGRPFHFAR